MNWELRKSARVREIGKVQNIIGRLPSPGSGFRASFSGYLKED
jgi:hypothetical protein